VVPCVCAGPAEACGELDAAAGHEAAGENCAICG